MTFNSNSHENWRYFLAIGPSAFFCFSAAPTPKTLKPPKTDKLFQKKLAKDDQILHALDRLTFGPRPGDVERLKRSASKSGWISSFIPNASAENPVLEAQLQPLESLHMTPMETVQHYPPPQMIQAIANGKQPMPDDPILRATIERLIARYKAKREGLETLTGRTRTWSQSANSMKF